MTLLAGEVTRCSYCGAALNHEACHAQCPGTGSETYQSPRVVPFSHLPDHRQMYVYAWYVNLPVAERRRLDQLDDEAFEAEYAAARRSGL